MEAVEITIEATMDAPVGKVWECWTRPEHITQWNFAADTWQCAWAKNDLKVGGKYTARMEAKDGSFGFDFEAIYDEVVDQKKIAYTMLDGRKAITDFEEVDGKVRVATTFDAETQNPIDFQKQGWQAILNNFKKYVEGNIDFNLNH